MTSSPHTAEVFKAKRIPKGEVKFKDFQLKAIQKPVIEFIQKNEITIIISDPGCSKTTMALYHAIIKLRKREFERIVITKPIVEAGTSIGFLPGTLDEKIANYIISYEDIIDQLVGVIEREKLFKDEKIVFEPIQFARGRTYKDSFVIFDEAQGCTLHELMTFTTRLDHTSKMIILTDPIQSDIKHSEIKDFLEIMKDDPEVGIMELGEEFQMRRPLIQRIYKKYKAHLKSKEDCKQTNK